MKHTIFLLISYCCAFSPDGTQIVSGSWDRTLKIWDAQTGQELHTLKGYSDEVQACVFSPDGTQIVSGDRDGTLTVWDARTGCELHTLKGHKKGVVTCAFSPDGAFIASIGEDSTLKLFRKISLLDVVIFLLSAPGTALTVSNKGMIAAGDKFGNVYILQVHGIKFRNCIHE